MRVMIGEFKHETNVFCSVPSTEADFRARSLKYGNDILTHFEGVRVELGGIIDGCRARDMEMLPVVAANASPGGIVSQEFFDHVLEKFLSEIERVKDIDGIVLSLHGAMVTEKYQDGDGEFLKALREKVGPEVFIVTTLDLHANITPMMLEAADAFFPYNSYPHVDYYERGFEAVNCMADLLSGDLNPVMEVCWIPALVPALTTLLEPMSSINEKAFNWEGKESVVNVAAVHGFPWADTEYSTLSILAITNDDEDLAHAIVDDMEKTLRTRMNEFISSSISVADAVQQAMDAEKGPVVLAEESDNPGGGAPCDGTFLLSELIGRKASDVAVALIVDPETVERAIDAGVGSTGLFSIGGKVENPDINGEPLEVSATVRTISDGVYINKGPMAYGVVNDLGRTAVLEIEGIEVIVSEKRVQPWDPEIFRRHGIEPSEKKIIAVKSAGHYRAAFSEFASEMINVKTPGLLSSDFSSFNFKHISKDIFPLSGEENK